MPMLREGTRSVASILKEVELMIRRLRAVFVIALMAVPFALPTSARAQSCAPTDLTCTVDQVGRAAQDVADDPGGTAHDGVDTAVGTGQDVIDTAHDTTKDAVGTVRNTIDQILEDGADRPPTGGGDGGPGGGGSGHRPGGSNGPGHNPHGGVGASRPAGGAGPVPLSPIGDEPGVPAVDPSSQPSDRGPLPTIVAVAAGVIGGVALMAVLLGAVVAFLAIQDRIDRRDPKLAMAAVGSDRVSFA